MKYSCDSTRHKVKLQRSTAQTFVGLGRVWTVQTTQTQKVWTVEHSKAMN